MSQRYRVIIDPHASRQLRRVRSGDRSHISEAMDSLRPNARPYGAIKLRGGGYRLRWGNWRIFYDINDAERVVTITDVLRRNERTYRDV